MRRDVLRCKELVERSRQITVSLPTTGSSYGGSTNKRGPASALEKSWAMKDRKHLDALIARSFYSGGISFNFARNPYFQQAISFACNRNLAGYKMPGYNKLRTSLLKQERGHIEMLLQSSKSTWQEKGVTICADGWSDPQRRPLINFVVVSEKAPMFLRADNCEGQVKTKEYIAEKLKSVIEEVGRQNVVQIITDNAANCKGAGLLIEAEYENIFWTPCVVHTLNLALKSICEPKLPKNEDEEFVWKQLEFIHVIKSEAQIIKNFIMNHGMRLFMFNEFSHLKLLAIAETRFASIVCMLKRMVEVQMPLKQMVISEAWDIYKDDAQTAALVHDKTLTHHVLT
ncbi:uncharacterized protein LOC133907386 [Phragmites australis]|uniref:uncharacterized protein LOC133907386 n=1 Tax=Phragmites australis TaxID=29695 RepID=UPI002D770244|nr:uncharacterized protein LOC133907386 [Phragmites australis]